MCLNVNMREKRHADLTRCNPLRSALLARPLSKTTVSGSWPRFRSSCRDRCALALASSNFNASAAILVLHDRGARGRKKAQVRKSRDRIVACPCPLFFFTPARAVRTCSLPAVFLP